MKVYLQTLTPLHIGTGEVLQQIDYVVANNRFYKITSKDFENFIALFPPNEKIMDKYIQWIDDHVETLQMQGVQINNKLSSYQNKKFKIDDFAKNIQKTKELNAYLAKKEGYKISGSVKTTVKELAGGDGKQHHIAGSTIKGAIRTAVIYKTLTLHGKTYKKHIMDSIRKQLRESKDYPSRLAKKLGLELEQVCYCGEKKTKQGQEITDYTNVQLDLLKFVTVSDAALSKNTSAAIEILATDLYLVGKEGNGRNSEIKAMKQGQTPSVEAIQKGVSFQLSIDFHLRELLAVYQNRHSSPKLWVGLEQKVEHLFGIKLAEVKQDNIEIYTKKAEDYIWSAITDFAKAQIKVDTQWLNNYLSKPLSRDIKVNTPKEFMKSFEPIFQYSFSQNTLLRMGFGTGFTSSTELLYFLSDEDMKKLMEEVMKRLNLGSPRKSTGGSYRPDVTRFPKSRLFSSPDEGVIPIGWIELKKEGSKEEDKVNIEEKTKTVVPEFSSQKLKIGSIIEGVLMDGKTKNKVFDLYLVKPIKQKQTINYFADLEEGCTYKIKIMAIDKNGTVLSAVVMNKK